MNKTMLLGNLGADPIIRHTAAGKAVCQFNIATTERWTNSAGEPQKRAEWHRIVVWAGQAEACAKYLSKGRTVLVEGRLQTRSWDDKNGVTRYTTEIVAQHVQFIGSGNGNGQAHSEEDADLASLMNLVEEPAEAPKTPPKGKGRAGK